MNKDLKIKPFNNILPAVTKLLRQYGKHAVLGAVLVVLVVYIFLVLKISSLSKAEPASGQTGGNVILIPRVNQKAIRQIQSLEDNNAQIRSLFEQARNNPFSE